MKKIKELLSNEHPGKNFLKKEPKYFCLINREFRGLKI